MTDKFVLGPSQEYVSGKIDGITGCLNTIVWLESRGGDNIVDGLKIALAEELAHLRKASQIVVNRTLFVTKVAQIAKIESSVVEKILEETTL